MRVRTFFDLLPSQPYWLSQLWSITFYVMILGLVYMFYKRIRSLNNRRCLVFWKDGTQSIRDYKIEEGKLNIRKAGLGDKSKNWTPTVKSENVIPAKRNFRSMIRPVGFKQKDLFIAVEDSPELVTIKGAIEDLETNPKFKPSVLLKTWSKPEVAKYINKAIAKGTVNRKVFSDTQFYMFFMILILNMILNVLIVRGLGII